MTTEYVATISRRDPEYPLGATVLIEFGTSAENPLNFTLALANLAEMLRVLGTPEKVARYIEEHSFLAQAGQFLLKGK